MAPPYSHGSSFSSSFYPSRPGRHHDDSSLVEDFRAFLARLLRVFWRFAKGRGRKLALIYVMDALKQFRRNLTARRLFCFPHALVVVWIFILLWGERWVFQSKVEKCQWQNWESWPQGATPHHLIFVADPQLIDPHSYPGRPWPLNPLTVLVTDNYLRRSYNQLQLQLRPDTVFFLGDLFDGGREWKTLHGDFKDPDWSHRPVSEQSHAKKWNKQYGENFWLREYARFGDIFFGPWNAAGSEPGVGQRGRKLIASLPGNHDLGFGSEVKVSVRDRFECYFGDTNRVDVIANHTFVSVDTVSLSADSSDQSSQGDVQNIFKPVEHFLNDVKWTKQKAVAKELRYHSGGVEEVRFHHRVEDLDKANFEDMPSLEGQKSQADLPTILLTHVPLYRPPGTPCGPMREHWPPAKVPKGEKGPVVPDHRNAISVSGGYQYQNVLTEEDSVNLVKKVGNVIHAFSGDDHDYCEVTHEANQENVPEITVKSISMAMGVPTPGFLMMSMYNPIDASGNKLPGQPDKTIQTHLCLLPRQLSTFTRYGVFILATIVLLSVRAFLVPVLKLQPFALDSGLAPSSLLPVFKAKVEDYDPSRPHGSGASGFRSHASSASRDRSHSLAGSLPTQPRSAEPKHKGRRHSKESAGGWDPHHEDRDRGPRIMIRGDDEFYDGGKWKAAQRGGGGAGGAGASGSVLGVVGREVWTTVWRVAWMVVAFWGFLAYRG